MDLSWGQAWPLFVILVGVASLVTTILEWRPGIAGFWSFTWPIVWIGVGILLLLSTTGRLGTGPFELIEQGWPWLLVGLGIWFLIGAVVPGARPTERLVIPLDGATGVSVKLRHGAGTLTSRVAAPGNLVDGEFRGGVTHRVARAWECRARAGHVVRVAWPEPRVGLDGRADRRGAARPST